MGKLQARVTSLWTKRHTIIKWCVTVILTIVVLSFTYLITLKFIPPPFTPLMFKRCFESLVSDGKCQIKKDWTSLSEISFLMQKAVISGEDPNFLIHNGFDFEAIEHAMKVNEHRRVKMGASTISQQTAKNVFLYPSRTYTRKALEAYFTLLIESFWSKRRILEIYLNVVELGKGIYGVESAARFYFKKSAKDLNKTEATFLAAMLPNPRKWTPVAPTKTLMRRRNFVSNNMQILGNSYFKPLKEETSPLPTKKKKNKKKKRKEQ